MPNKPTTFGPLSLHRDTIRRLDVSQVDNQSVHGAKNVKPKDTSATGCPPPSTVTKVTARCC